MGHHRDPAYQYGGGGDWYTDPTSMPNLLKAAAERFNLPPVPSISRSAFRSDLCVYPMIYLTGMET
jgi:hypothetical protein